MSRNSPSSESDLDAFFNHPDTMEAAGGLLLLSEGRPRSPPPSPSPSPPIPSSSEVPCGLDGKTWDCKKKRSRIRTFSAPPPSPEDEPMKELYQKFDGLLNRKAIFSQELQKIEIHKDKQIAFGGKLKEFCFDIGPTISEEEEAATNSVSIGAEVDDKPTSAIVDSAETHQNQGPLSDGNEASLVNVEAPQQADT